MTRRVRGLDRAVALLLGVVLLVVGVAAVLWWTGTLARLWPGAPTALEPARAADVTGASWFGAAATASGVVLGALVLWWLLAHLGTPRVRELSLAGSDASGRLVLDVAPLAAQVAAQARRVPGVLGARAVVDHEGGRHVLVSTLRVDPEADLDALSRDVADLVARTRDVTGLDDLAARTRLAVQRRTRGPRVR
ncbi:hypothetical protein LFM56_16910 [Cellulomonas iranensis]|uniref:hypothetical protein n=1 Tax=Cellulomonas iranensis TaxID=76862 RepID=UPI001CF55B78|nr:hypothetical protein [Cellulomonas iranensis]UCN14517.1 hypothetical protein LFM56_16910 [Cellulomonas iranensis]